MQVFLFFNRPLQLSNGSVVSRAWMLHRLLCGNQFLQEMGAGGGIGAVRCCDRQVDVHGGGVGLFKEGCQIKFSSPDAGTVIGVYPTGKATVAFQRDIPGVGTGDFQNIAVQGQTGDLRAAGQIEIALFQRLDDAVIAL